MGETFTDSTLALEVLSSMADNESFDDMNFEGEGQDLFDNMMEDAVLAAANSEDGAMMLGNMMANGSEESMGMMMDTIGRWVKLHRLNSCIGSFILYGRQ